MTPRSFATVATVGLAWALAVAGPARAEPDPAARTQAAAHTRQGQAYFQRQDYDRAIAEYQAAFDLSAEPSLIFNIALCYDRTNRPEQALAAFQRYLQLAPEGTVSDEARTDVARLVPIVEKIAVDRTAQEAEARQEAQRRQQAALREAAAHNAAVAHRAQVSRMVMLSGAAIAVTGAAFDLLAFRTRDRLPQELTYDSYLEDRHTAVLRHGVAIGAYAVGGATIATGLVLALLAGKRTEVPQLSAAIAPGGATVVMGWSR